MRELPTSPMLGHRQKLSGVFEVYHAHLYDTTRFYIKLGELLEEHGLQARFLQMHLVPCISTLLDSVICFPVIEPNWLSPCPYHELARSVGHKQNSHIVRKIIDEMYDYIKDFILEELKRHDYEYVIDFTWECNEQVTLIGARRHEYLRQHG